VEYYASSIYESDNFVYRKAGHAFSHGGVSFYALITMLNNVTATPNGYEN